MAKKTQKELLETYHPDNVPLTQGVKDVQPTPELNTKSVQNEEGHLGIDSELGAIKDEEMETRDHLLRLDADEDVVDFRAKFPKADNIGEGTDIAGNI